MDVIRVFSKVTVGLSEGEVLQITAKGDVDTSEETYYRIIGKKTAGFIAGCCEIGAMLAGASPAALAALTSYGMNLGLAFQIADDLLDYTGDPQSHRQAALRRSARRQDDPAADPDPGRCDARRAARPAAHVLQEPER